MRKRAPAPPLGVVAALTAGFETVNAQLPLIILPIALDLLLWLGPRLSILPLVERMVGVLSEPAAGPETEGMRQMLDLTREALLSYGAGFNVFALLSPAPVGVPSLLAGQAIMQTPAGAPALWPVDSVLVYALLFGVFTLAGLWLGAVYYNGIAQQVRDGRLAWGRLARQVWGDWARLTALAVILALVFFVLGGPTLVLAGLLSLFSPLLGNVVFAAGALVLMWVLIFGSYTLPGLLLSRRGLLGALWDSLRLVQASVPQTTGLFGAVILINFGLSLIWNLPSSASWLRLVGVGGHALVSTALVAATFVFYQDRYRWWLETRPAVEHS